MAVLFNSEGVKVPKLPRQTIKKWISLTAENYQKRVGEVSYIFCSDEEILRINNQYLNHDFYTDIITFDYTEGDLIAGDIFISLDTVKSNSEKYKTDYDEELHRVIIHGILHLCGLEDKKPDEEKQMREAENRALELLKTL
ncbi:MAG: rRNA maturation RNase YbeY [Dysgonamonadaceae bacterium]|nr:rRNA maturation RNase YbeY [Dysgonamonadaceae bacterium]